MDIPQMDWYQSRSYLHFDLPVNINKAVEYVTNSKLVSQHAFYPLINYDILIDKVYFNKVTKRVEKVNPQKKRTISYPAHMDSHIYSYYSKLLDHLYENKIKENKIDDSILAFRKLGKSNVNFSLNAFNKIKDVGECCVIAFDVSSFFSTLDHNILKNEWCDLLNEKKLPKDHFNLYKALIKEDSIDKEKLYKLLGISLNKHKNKGCDCCKTKVNRCLKCKPKNIRRRVCEPKDFRSIVRKSGLISKRIDKVNGCGIPQGTPISAMLSNIYMFKFDFHMKKEVKAINGEYFRYCDDMLFIVPIEEQEKIVNIVKEKISDIKLTINDKKTEVRVFKYKDDKLKSDKPLQYLGFIFDGNNIFIRSSSLSRYSNRMRRGVRLAKRTKEKYNNIKLNDSLIEHDLFKRKLYSRYTHLGKRNFITYGIRSAKIMNSDSIRKQLKPLLSRFKKQLEENNASIEFNI